ncbi:hypothetical protein [Chryseobacterium aquaeductus]|uniref:hypothetical protein n=1 Tax=Chryseobacterium aquaeductus TaxID=2675056 RepID=UPI0013896479|nr:hypothetical protein [Chryseobacterium aquaeductus]
MPEEYGAYSKYRRQTWLSVAEMSKTMVAERSRSHSHFTDSHHHDHYFSVTFDKTKNHGNEIYSH